MKFMELWSIWGCPNQSMWYVGETTYYHLINVKIVTKGEIHSFVNFCVKLK